MYRPTKYQTVGYLLIVAGIVTCLINYIYTYQANQNFGYFPVYILSGIVTAAGLTLAFNDKLEKEDINGVQTSTINPGKEEK